MVQGHHKNWTLRDGEPSAFDGIGVDQKWHFECNTTWSCYKDHPTIINFWGPENSAFFFILLYFCYFKRIYWTIFVQPYKINIIFLKGRHWLTETTQHNMSSGQHFELSETWYTPLYLNLNHADYVCSISSLLIVSSQFVHYNWCEQSSIRLKKKVER